jgi:hypothetical protein
MKSSCSTSGVIGKTINEGDSTMTCRLSRICALIMAVAGTSVYAQVGELTGSGSNNTFSITIRQGNTVLLQDNAVPFPADIKTPGLTHIPLNDSLGNWSNEIDLQVHSEGGPEEDLRVTHWYLGTTGSDSLFDPSNSDTIDVEISGISFDNGAYVLPMVLDQDDYYVSYFMDEYGRYYQTPGTNTYGTYNSDPWQKIDVQVPGNEYRDADIDPHSFESLAGTEVSWAWKNIIPPGTTTLAVGNDGSTYENDFVYEMGLGVSFAVVPEPAALILCMGALPLLVWGRSRRGG